MSMGKQEEPATILIAGGGIVGLALAMSIKKQLGVTPEIYEKTSTFATEGTVMQHLNLFFHLNRSISFLFTARPLLPPLPCQLVPA